MKKLARTLACLSMGLGSLHYIGPKSGNLNPSILVYLVRLLAGALAPPLAVLGAAGLALGLPTRAPLAVVSGAMGAWLSARYVAQVVRPHKGFEQAFGPGWQEKIPPDVAARMLKHRWTWLAPTPPQNSPVEIEFWKIRGARQRLTCNLWRRPPGVGPSGLAFIYLHPGGWQEHDKDLTGTRPFFRHLTGQGHVVMDVSYRLVHETDMRGIVADVKRAIVWMKDNAKKYDVDPERVVVGGGSAGGHLALLAAYAPNHPQLDPEDVDGKDTSVRAVVSYYGPPDLRDVGEGDYRPSSPLFVWFARSVGLDKTETHLDWPDLWRALLGGPPSTVPQETALMSPITHVGAHCPPTLLLHGTHDRIVPVEDARKLYRALSKVGVQVVYTELPGVVHAFDLALLKTSPSAQAALYDVERFLALMTV